MSGRQHSPYDSIALRWLALVEHRQQNFIELCNTGRWRRYYTPAEFLDEMRKILDLRNRWARLAGVPMEDQPDVQHVSKQSEQRGAELGERQPDLPRRPTPTRRRSASAILTAVAERL
jgi:uncharacterized repeat protein (TIGR03809 family)